MFLHLQNCAFKDKYIYIYIFRRINIGQKYQAEIPEFQDQPSSQFDLHKADLVWIPMEDSHLKHGDQESS